MSWKPTSDQRNGGPEKYQDMFIGVIPRDKVDPRYLAKLRAGKFINCPTRKYFFVSYCGN